MLDRRWDDLFRHQPTDLLPRDEPVTTDGSRPQRLIRLRHVVDRFRGRLGERRTESEAEH